jgi:hypothetical protein
MARACRHCGARISRLADRCLSCDGANDPETPWYVYVVGGVIVLALFVWLADFESLGRLFDLFAGWLSR